MKRVCILLPFLVLLCGCYPYTEIENMDILTSVYIGRANDMVRVGGGVANVRSFSDAMAEEPVSLISAEGETLEAATINLQQSADHPLFFGAMRAVVLEKNFAKENIMPFLRYLDAQPRSRRSTAVFVTDADLESVIRHKAVNDFSAGFAADSILTTLYEDGYVHYMSMGDILYAASCGEAGFPVARIAVDNSGMRLDGYAIFRGGKCIGVTNNPAIVCFMRRKASVQYVLDGLPVEAQVINKKVDLQEKDGKLHAYADFTFAVHAKDATLLRDVQLLEVKEKLREKLTAALGECRTLGCDFLQLYQTSMTRGRENFDMTDWNMRIAQMAMDVNVEVEAR